MTKLDRSARDSFEVCGIEPEHVGSRPIFVCKCDLAHKPVVRIQSHPKPLAVKDTEGMVF